jgi:prohibitin 1
MDRVLRRVQIAGLGAAACGIAYEYCIYDVDAGTRAVIFDRFMGLQQKVPSEGTHLKWPWQSPRFIDIRSRPRTINSSTGTKDLQMVNISLRVLSRPVVDKLPHIYQTLGPDFDELIFTNLGNEVLKAVVAQYNAEELLSKRALVSERIRKELVERAAKFNLILDDVSITHLTFGREFAKAIENKQVAQQEAETQFYLVAKADQERKASIIRAEGEAEAAELISKAMLSAGTGLIEVRRIDTAKDVAAILAKGRNVTYLPNTAGGSGGSGSSGGMLLGINTGGQNSG